MSDDDGRAMVDEREWCQELEETLREAVRIIAPRENRQATREGQDFLIRARRVLTPAGTGG